MKRLLISLACALSLQAHAQWREENQAPDELKGTSGYSAYVYESENSCFLMAHDIGHIQIRLKQGSGGGSTTLERGYSGQLVLFGLYDSDDDLVEKIQMWLDRPRDSHHILRTRDAGTMFNPVGQKGKVKKIIKHLTKTDGYVRIVAARWDNSDLDIKIPYYSKK